MAIIQANEHQFDVDCVVLDKDGTVLDFDFTWGRRIVSWIRALAHAANGDQDFIPRFSQAIGYNWKERTVLADSPLAVTTAGKLTTLAAGALYQRGILWHEAERLAAETMRQEIGAPFKQSDVRAVGDVRAAVRRLREAGLVVALVTGDERASTESLLALLGIDGEIAVTICGDDALPDKPDPAALFQVSEQTGIPTERMLMVGDTANDMLTGRNAGAAGCIGITGSSGDPAKLAAYADVLLTSIDQLVVVESG